MDMHDVAVRLYKNSDAQVVSALIRLCWETMRLGDYDEKGVQAQIRSTTPEDLDELAESTRFYVAEHKGEVIGFGGHDQDKVRLFFVKPEFQRRGVGGLILAQVLANAKEEGVCGLECNSTTFAEPFFAKHGFAKTGNLNLGIIHFVKMAIDVGSEAKPRNKARNKLVPKLNRVAIISQII